MKERKFRLKIDALSVFDITSVKRKKNLQKRHEKQHQKITACLHSISYGLYSVFFRALVIQIYLIFSKIILTFLHCYYHHVMSAVLWNCPFHPYKFLTFKAFCCFGNHSNKILTHAICLVSRVFLSSFYLYSLTLSRSLFFYHSNNLFVKCEHTETCTTKERKKRSREDKKRKNMKRVGDLDVSCLKLWQHCNYNTQCTNSNVTNSREKNFSFSAQLLKKRW